MFIPAILFIHRLVKGILGFYYKSDAEVSQDSELQTWIEDIFEHGFLSQQCTGETRLLFRHVFFCVSFIGVLLSVLSGVCRFSLSLRVSNLDNLDSSIRALLTANQLLIIYISACDCKLRFIGY